MFEKRSFQKCWLQDNEWKTEVKWTKSLSEADCLICLKNMVILNMGEQG